MKVHIALACSKAPTEAKHETLADMDCEDESVNGDDDVDAEDYLDLTPMKKQKTQQSPQMITNYVHVGSISKPMALHLDREQVKFIVGCNVPFKVVDSVCFRRFIKRLQPRYKVPSSTRVRDTLFWEKTSTVL